MLMVLCALSGYAAARLLPERIEATATLSISIDHHRTGVLTDLEQDRMIGVSEDIIRSADVLEAIRIQSEIRAWMPTGCKPAHQRPLAADSKRQRSAGNP